MLDAEGNDLDAHVVKSKVYEKKHGWVYEISMGEGPAYIYQDYHPDKPGFVPMTEEEAKELANKLVEAHQKAMIW